ncbi:hypothetical protein JAAARDRAFT_194847 [Jaapia argillacea MUCL 33604]|uniref:DUF1308 domain-containing protein n=1 Tax=Jaapia argillacea MUCL 33604 TaxID=933084 RepID=A0A067PQ19_9AGAM|nr:hypothetical protein JAAARDRAFT_194847 [Jaapia argillacea MUCL 33604]
MASTSQLSSLRSQLAKTYSSILSYQPKPQQLPILDSSPESHDSVQVNEDHRRDTHDLIPGLSKFREIVKRDLDVLDEFLSSPSSARPPSTNAPYLIAVWDEVSYAPQPVLGICQTFSLAADCGQDHGIPLATANKEKKVKTKRPVKPVGVKVDVVADGGRKWIRVNTIKNSRILSEFTEIDSYLTDSDSESHDGGPIRSTKQTSSTKGQDLDNSILRMTRGLIAASRSNRISSRSVITPDAEVPPEITLRLTRLSVEDEAPRCRTALDEVEDVGLDDSDRQDPRIGLTVERVREMDIDVQFGERPQLCSVISAPAADSTPSLRHYTPTRQVNLDLSLLVALISDITHARLPSSVEEAEGRYVTSIGPKSREKNQSRRESSSHGEDSPQPTFLPSRQLANQLLQEMGKGLLTEMHDQLRVNEDEGLEFWTTAEARDRLIGTIVDTIGGEQEKRRANALFLDGTTLEDTGTFWVGSRYPTGYLPLIPIRLFDNPPSSAAKSFDESSSDSRTADRFFYFLSKTCRDILAEHDRRTAAGRSEPTSSKLTPHTIRSMLYGAERGWTTMTANRASVKALLREMKTRYGYIGETGDKAAIWIVDPRSLGESVRSENLLVRA